MIVIMPQGRDRMTTYRRADGALWSGEYAFYTERESVDTDVESGFEDCVEVVVERWVRAGVRTLVLGETSRWCAECDEDIELDEPVDGPVYCPACQPS